MTVPVSVVMPYFDRPRQVGTALASVAAQTARPAQVIIVDDGSDTPVREALGSEGHGLDLHIVTLPANEGPGPARNAGVAVATSPYVAFLDTDDVWLEDKLRQQYAFMAAWPELDATHTEVVFAFADGRELRREPGAREMSVPGALSGHTMITPTIMMKRTSFERLGGFDPAFRCTQDWDLQIRIALEGLRVQFLPEVLARVSRGREDHHSWNWRCYLAGHLRIVWKHRVAYRARGGFRSWVRRITYECWRGGHIAGGLIGSGLKIPYRLGL